MKNIKVYKDFCIGLREDFTKELKVNSLVGQFVRYNNNNDDEIVGIITAFEENEYTKGFRISFRLYNVTEGIGGFETTLWVKNASIDSAKMFIGDKNEYKHAAKLLGATIDSVKTDNKVPKKFQYSVIRSKFK